MNTTKEELREKLDEIIKLYPECFEHISDYGRMLIFNLFWKEIEQRDANAKQYFDLWNPVDQYVRRLPSVRVGDSVLGKALELLKRTESLEQLLKAADEVINCGQSPSMTDGYASGKYWDAKKIYTQLKSKTTLKQQMK